MVANEEISGVSEGSIGYDFSGRSVLIDPNEWSDLNVSLGPVLLPALPAGSPLGSQLDI